MLLLVAALAAAPCAVPLGTRALAAAGRICIFVVLAASYDILLGYTGIVSFAHAVFFAIGAYGVAIPLAARLGRLGRGRARHRGGGGGGDGGGRRHRPAQPARAGAVLLDDHAGGGELRASCWRPSGASVTGGEDGLTFAVPWVLTPAFRAAPVRASRSMAASSPTTWCSAWRWRCSC